MPHKPRSIIPRRKLNWRFKRRYMTIAAGFNFDDGAILCADTKHTGGMTLYETKLFRREYQNGGKSVFAFSGSSYYAKMAVQKCESAIAKLRNRPTVADISGAVESALVKVHRTHIDKHPDRNMEGGPDFLLLAAFWSPVDGLKTFSTSQTAIVPFDVYDCIGSGNYLGHYIIRPRYRSLGSLLRAVAVATTALQRIKSYDSNCGGYSQFIMVTKAGTISEIGIFDIAQKEKFAEEFHEGAEEVYTTMADFEANDADVEKKFAEFKTSIMIERAKHQADKDERERIVKLLSDLGISLRLSK